MVRTYKPKTTRNLMSDQKIQDAIKDVLSGDCNVSKAAKLHSIKRTTLRDRLRKITKLGNNEFGETKHLSEIVGKYSSKYTSNQVFTNDEERDLCEYLNKSCGLQYGLSKTTVQHFVYEYAKEYNIKMPSFWMEKHKAGIDWLQGFMKRNQEFLHPNEDNTTEWFFKSLQNLLDKQKTSPTNIYCLDEMAIPTKLEEGTWPTKSFNKQVLIVKMVVISNAVGVTLPPAYIFPRIRLKKQAMYGGPIGCLGISSKKSQMTIEGLLRLLEHIRMNTNFSKYNPIILIMDFHICVSSFAVVKFCQENGVHLITFPSHMPDQLKPLKIVPFKKFEEYLLISFKDFLAHNSRITIYDIPMLSNIPFIKSFHMEDIRNGFKQSGIYPCILQNSCESYDGGKFSGLFTAAKSDLHFQTEYMKGQYDYTGFKQRAIESDCFEISLPNKYLKEPEVIGSSGKGNTKYQIQPVSVKDIISEQCDINLPFSNDNSWFTQYLPELDEMILSEEKDTVSPDRNLQDSFEYLSSEGIAPNKTLNWDHGEDPSKFLSFKRLFENKSLPTDHGQINSVTNCLDDICGIKSSDENGSNDNVSLDISVDQLFPISPPYKLSHINNISPHNNLQLFANTNSKSKGNFIYVRYKGKVVLCWRNDPLHTAN
ncbi:uncharacterized protein LOC142228901 [Haematobia irritans]|uniref:uncharacterized protein LOC142228901 n=1 Tax=Haematobia irritans TaxID=7368 RepID=UPI003F50B6B5